MEKLRIEGVGLEFTPRDHKTVTALDNISLNVAEKEFAVIVGPSGCGKSSLLRLAAGLMRPTSGAIWLNDKLVTEPGKERGMVFQSYTLFPWLTVQENVEFGPRLSHVAKAERSKLARDYLAQVGLEGFEDRYPKHLSGGMKQRVALARAMVNNPDVLLMDEPFGALDSQTRSLMQELLLSVWEKSHKTVLFVTHDIDEAILLGDTVYVMTARPGRIKETIPIGIARPRTVDLLTSPEFVSLKRRIMKLIHDEAVLAGR
ncbi:ABC transporter ATP-binding protein [Mesorhizobium sp. VK25A]|uniref:ABC transporter ATP-binding protein n=2 Tax=Mesorhizobium TaxID=68287 RepID=A0ABU5AAM5_9HYPH|nr:MULTISPECIES: ABC transporter ATP-binding protein [unclassified Mesorhizobium]MDX8469846.1 ABC transporter ATP-binding protein [Mesorhizobium sp. VK23B]MDX8476185.1 ABC transporter ATP-binding protein [Mesorhizobium sp. VK23A]MDX8501781.1 ABC transporter ATP-binding protein [Mesorhizobium sp. VK4C]MDX8505540.1 ABC transporter ATP-binding protein [Mesorhizobium sp. VK22E]MDX8534235.1 ABC transporter ATP-binding protein [Mesorhizobium sp. VK25D]